MSGYQYGHGQWPQPPPQFAQYEYPPSSNQSQYPYIPSSSQQPLSQDPQHQTYYGAAQTAQASQAGFDHNAQVHGLGIDVDSAASRSPNAVGGELSWSEAFGGAPAAATPSSSYNPSAPSYQHPQQHYQSSSSRTPTSYQQQNYGHQKQYSQQQYTPQIYQQPPPPPPPQQQHQHQHQQHQSYPAPSHPSVEQGQASEEGELSDDMDDAYDPEEPSNPALYPATQAPSSTSSQDAPVQPTEAYLQPASPEMPGTALGQAAVDMPSRDVSVIDTQDDAFYDEDEDDEPGEIKSTGKALSVSDAADADVEDMDYSDSATSKSLAAATGEAAEDRAMSYSPRLSPGEIEDKVARPEILNGAANGHHTPQQAAVSSTAVTYATVDEAKKKAQQAILRLIRYDVNYQAFIDEGVDGQVIKSLFTELGLKTDSPKTADGTASLAAQATAQAVPLSSKEATASNPPSATADESASKKEERKDRIARLLALKKASKPTPGTATLPAPAAPAPKADVKSEKARLLQQKLEALRQAQEERAKAAALNQTVPAALPLSIPVPTHHPLPPRPTTTSNSFTPLPTATAAAVDAVNSRKRPVAADFGDFSKTHANAYKRPYGIARQDSTLVIDVSDDEPSQNGHDEGEYDEDEDDDVEMELESQADETVSHVTDFTGQKNSNGMQSQDQLAPSAYGRFAGNNGQATPQPPTAPASMIARAKDDEYARKMRQIEDMKRKIAEAEAKKHRGTSTGSVTPVTGGYGTPPEPDTTSTPNNSQGRNFDAAQIVRPPPQPMRRITSTGELTGSARIGSGDSAIRLPKRGNIQPSPSPLSSRGSSIREERARAASLQLPRVEASLQEKMFKLRLLQDKVNALQSEIEDGISEKRRLTEDLEDLDAESEAPVADAAIDNADSVSIVEDNDAVDGPVPQQSVKEAVQQPVEEAVAEVEPVAESEPIAADVDMNVAEDVVETEAAQAPTGVAEAAVTDAVADVEADAEADVEADVEAGEYEPMLSDDKLGSELAPMSVASSPPYEPVEDFEMTGTAESGEDGEIVEEDEDEDKDEDKEEEDSDDDDEDEDMIAEDDGDVFIIDDGEPTDAAPMPVVEEAEVAAEAEVEADVANDTVQPSVAPAPVAAPAATATATGPTPAPASTSTFTAYDSPLQYFRSYRFHPQYKAQVAGGLKSLTYSGKIRDDIQLCPAESEGEDCTNPACPFQHFSSIMPQDDQILVELGRSDEYTGEQQSRFVDGLKAVLKQVREDQVRDFDTIADAIISFRRKFLADETRILANLGGTSV